MRLKINSPSSQISTDMYGNTNAENSYLEQQNQDASFLERLNATGSQLKRNVQKGALGTLEGVLDFGTNIVAGIGNLFGADTQGIQDFAKRDLAEEYLDSKVGRFLSAETLQDTIKILSGDDKHNTREYLDNVSFVNELSPKTKEIIYGVEEGVGQLLLLAATAGAGNAAGLSSKAIQATNMGIIGTSAAGKSSTEALIEGKTIGEALAYGSMSGALEVGIEMISGGAMNKIAQIPALTNVGSKLANLAKNNRTLQVALQYLGDAAGEGAEEMVSEILDPLIKRAAYMDDEGIDNATIEEVFTAGLIGSLTSMVVGGAEVSVKLNSNILNNIESDINSEVSNYRTSQKTDDDTQLYNDNLSKYRTELEQRLGNMKDGGKEYIERMQQSGNRLYQNYDFDNKKINDNSFARATEIKKVDTSSLTEEQRNSQTVQDIIALEQRANEKNGLSNNIIIDEDIKSVNGKIVNGYIDTDGNIHVNLSSNQAPLETLIHEMSHSIENTLGYQVLKSSLFSEQEINDKITEISPNYENINNVDLEAESIATLMQESFGDSKYVNMLYQKEPGVFRKIYNWFKSFLKGEHKTKLEKEQEKLVKSYLETFESALEESKNVATTKKIKYNVDNKEVNTNVKEYKPTNDFRRIQEASLQLSDNDIQMFHNGSKRIDDSTRGILEAAFRGQINASRDSVRYVDKSIVNNKTGKEFTIHKNINGTLFHDIFEIVQKYLPNGDCVDVHDIKSSDWSIGYEKCKCYLAEDGLSGFAITPSGDLISVFNLGKQGFLYSIKDYVKAEGAKTLDCYQSKVQPLATIYSKTLGFKIASILDFNYDILLEDKGKKYADYFVKTYGESPVHFMVNTNADVQSQHFTENQYEQAVEYQKSFVNKSNSENINKYSLSSDTKTLLDDNRTKNRVIKLLQKDAYKQNQAYNKLLEKYNSGQMTIQDLVKKINFQDAVIAIAEAKYEVERKQLTKENKQLIKEVEQGKATAWELIEELNIWKDIAEIRRLDVKAMEEMSKVYNRVNAKFKEIKIAKNKKSFNPNLASSTKLAPFVQLGVDVLGKMTRGANISSNTKTVIGEYLSKFYTQDNPLLGSYYDADLAAQMDEFARSSGNPNHGIKTAGNVKLNLDNLKMLEKVYTGFMKIVNDYGKVLHDNKVVEAKTIVDQYSPQVVKMADNAYKSNGNRKINPTTSRYVFETSKADTIAKVFDGTIGNEKGFIGDILEQIKQSENTVNKNIMDLNEALDEFIKKKGNKQYIRDIQNIKSKESIELKGKKITKDTGMYIYLLSLREQAKSHFMTDINKNAEGIVLRTGKGEYLATITLTQADIDTMYTQFNAKDLEFIEIAQNMFKKAGKLKTETDLARFGYTNATDTNYVPIVNDISNRTPRLASSENRVLDTILNLSFNKDTVKNATSKIYGVGLSQVFNKHVDQVSKYNGGMQTLESVQTIMNTSFTNESGVETNLWNELNRKSANFGKWFNNLVTDVYQVKTYDDYSKFFDKLRSNYAQTTLALNFKVIGTQFTGIITSLSELSPTSLLKGMGNLSNFKLVQAEMEENCTFIKYRKYNKEFVRSQGNFDGRISELGNKLTSGIEAIDNLTIHMIWQACKYEAEKTKGYKFGTKENLQEASILAEKVVRKTQDNHNSIDTPTLKRSGNDFVKSMFMFTTQPFQMLNMVYNDVSQINNYYQRLKEFDGKSADYKDVFGKTKQDLIDMKKTLSRQTARDVTAIIANNMAYALVAMLFKQWLGKDDKDKEFAEEVKDEFISSMISILPITSKIYTIVADGYSISETPINYVEDVIKSISSAADNPSKTNFYNAIKNLATLFGLPVKNLMDYMYATINTFSPELAYKFKNIYYDQPISTDKKIITDYIDTNESLSKAAFTNYLRKRGLDKLNDTYVDNMFSLVKEDIENLDKITSAKLTEGSTIKVSDEITEYAITKKDATYYDNLVQNNVSNLLSNSTFAKLEGSTTKSKTIKRVMEVSKYLAIMNNDSTIKLSNNKLANVSKYFNFDSSELISYYYYIQDLKASINDDSRKEKIIKYINGLRGLTTSQKLALIALAGYSLTDAEKNRIKQFLRSNGVATNTLQDQIINML